VVRAVLLINIQKLKGRLRRTTLLIEITVALIRTQRKRKSTENSKANKMLKFLVVSSMVIVFVVLSMDETSALPISDTHVHNRVKRMKASPDIELACKKCRENPNLDICPLITAMCKDDDP
ncbi:unnamed protein product, partial [Owenia fusiformis]